MQPKSRPISELLLVANANATADAAADGLDAASADIPASAAKRPHQD